MLQSRTLQIYAMCSRTATYMKNLHHIWWVKQDFPIRPCKQRDASGVLCRFSFLSQGTEQRGGSNHLQKGQHDSRCKVIQEGKIRSYLLLFPLTSCCWPVKLCQGVGDSGCASTQCPQHWRPSVLETHYMQASFCLLQSRAVVEDSRIQAWIVLMLFNVSILQVQSLLTFKPVVASLDFQCITWTIMSFLLICLIC